MAQLTIDLFMWAYQTHFRALLEHHARSVLSTMGLEAEATAFLIGVVRPGATDPNPVCIEPELGPIGLVELKGLRETLERIVAHHPLQRMRYGDEPSNRDKPDRIRRDSLRQAVQEIFAPLDKRDQMRSFCGQASPVENFEVVPIVRVPEKALDVFPALRAPAKEPQFRCHLSFVEAAIEHVLSEATAELLRPEPGRTVLGHMKRSDEIVRESASAFMKTPGVLIGDRNAYFDLFEQFNVIASLFYEGKRGIGRLILANPENPALEYSLRLAEPVPFRVPRWARKILQMASPNIALIGDCEHIHGLGVVKPAHDPANQDVFTIEFLDHYDWQLRCGDQLLLRSRYGEARLPQKPISEARFHDTFARLFPRTSSADVQRLWQLLEFAARQGHGSMVVVAEDAAEEVHRLVQQGTAIAPTLMTEALFRRVSSIDGTIVLDPSGVCHAIGVILDGPAHPSCSPARGSRYNSAIRYVGAASKARLAIVVSDDQTVDVIPMLRPRIRRTDIDAAIGALEVATLDNYHKPRKWLDEHRFYLDEAQCLRANSALDRIEKSLSEVGQMVIMTTRLQPNEAMSDEYFFPDEG